MTDDVQSFTHLLRTALSGRIAADATGFVEMVAKDVVMEFPFSPAGLPSRLEGREAVAAHLAALGKLITFDRMSLSAVHSVGPDLAILEFQGFGRGVETGEPYEQRYISRITTRDGRIVHYLDYWNPLVLLRTLKGATIETAVTLHRAYSRDH